MTGTVMTSAVLRRVVRRETHSPRTVPAVIVLTLCAVAAAYAGIEVVLHMVGARPLFVAPGSAAAWIASLPSAQPQAAVLGGAAVAILGTILLWLALAPGRRSRHALQVSSHAVVADNGVIAAALAARLRCELDLGKDGVVVGVGHRAADVTVRPQPGQAIDRAQVQAVAQHALAELHAVPTLSARARVRRLPDREEAS